MKSVRPGVFNETYFVSCMKWKGWDKRSHINHTLWFSDLEAENLTIEVLAFKNYIL